MNKNINIEKVAQAIEVDAGQSLNGLREALTDLKAGKITGCEYKPDQLKVIAARKATGLSQSKFALFINTPVRTLQEWEQGRSTPPGVALKLCELIISNPKMVA